MFKKIETLAFVFLCVVSVFSQSLHANEETAISQVKKFIPCSKTYIDSSQIGFFKNCIYVNMGELTIETAAVFSDENGLYFQNAKDDDCGILQRRCKNRICPACVFVWDSTCYTCGKKQ